MSIQILNCFVHRRIVFYALVMVWSAYALASCLSRDDNKMSWQRKHKNIEIRRYISLVVWLKGRKRTNLTTYFMIMQDVEMVGFGMNIWCGWDAFGESQLEVVTWKGIGGTKKKTTVHKFVKMRSSGLTWQHRKRILRLIVFESR